MIRGYNLRELLACIDGEATLAVEISVAHAVGVVVASVGVALSSEAVVGVGATAVVGLTNVILVLSARVRGESEGVGVGLPVVQGLDRHVAFPTFGIWGLPDINFGTAGTVLTDTSIGIVGGFNPAIAVGLEEGLAGACSSKDI
jgi:hypothetical protein